MLKRSIYAVFMLFVLAANTASAGTGSTGSDIYLYLILIGLLALVWVVGWLIDLVFRRLNGNPGTPARPELLHDDSSYSEGDH